MKSRSVLESKLSRANIKANILEQICDLVLDTTPAGESSIDPAWASIFRSLEKLTYVCLHSDFDAPIDKSY